jgi:excisionase family DNA binding protein
LKDISTRDVKKNDQFYSVKTLAEKLAINPMTVYRLVGEGRLPAVKIGRSIRFRPGGIDAFLETVRVGPGGLEDEGKKNGGEKHGSR